LQENCRLRKDIIAMEKAIAERLGYLQRYKVLYYNNVTNKYIFIPPQPQSHKAVITDDGEHHPSLLLV